MIFCKSGPRCHLNDKMKVTQETDQMTHAARGLAVVMYTSWLTIYFQHIR